MTLGNHTKRGGMPSFLTWEVTSRAPSFPDALGSVTD